MKQPKEPQHLTDFEVLSIIDDWVTYRLIDDLTIGFKTMKMGLGLMEAPRSIAVHSLERLKYVALVQALPASPKKRADAIRELCILFILDLVRSSHRPLVRSYLLETGCYALSLKRSSMSLSCPHLARIVPRGFTDRSMALMIKQIAHYMEFLSPESPVSINETARYGGGHAAVFAKRDIPAGFTIKQLCGLAVDILHSDEERLLSTGDGITSLKREFSLLFSSKKKQSQLLLGPARFVNHDCNPNVELKRISSMIIGFQTIRQVKRGEELVTFYGPNYFGTGNSDCLCQTCEE